MTSRPRPAISQRAGEVWSRVTTGIYGRGAISFMLATAGVNVSNFLFHVVVSRLLGPAHYGVVGAILSILNFLVVPIGAVQLAVTQAVIYQTARHERYSLGPIVRRGALGGLAAMVAFAALTPALESFLHIHSAVPLLVAAAWVPLAIVAALLQGALIGEYRFRPVAFATFMGGGPVRLLLGAVMVEAGFGVTGAVVATTLSQAFTTGALLVAARPELRGHERGQAVRTTSRDMIMSVAALGSYTTLIWVDTFLARHYFSPTVAGKYAAGAVAAHIALFIPVAIVTAAFPHLADGNGTSASSRRAFMQALKITVILGLVVAGGLTLFSGVVVHLLFGSKYAGATAVVGLLAFASAVVGVLSVFIYLHLARRSPLALTPWLGVVLAVALIAVRHQSMATVASIILIVSVAMLVVAGVPAFRALAAAARAESADPPAQG
jgi:O-antigen/teichoic acid export membrane protein